VNIIEGGELDILQICLMERKFPIKADCSNLKLRILEMKPRLSQVLLCPDLGVSSYQGLVEVAVKRGAKVLARLSAEKLTFQFRMQSQI